MTTTVTSPSSEMLKPPEPPGALTWVRKNLFNNWFNSLLSVVSLLVIFWAVRGALHWALVTADWSPVVDNPLLYLVGQYPRDSLWRLGIGLAILSLLIGMSWREWGGVLRLFALTYAVFLLIGFFWPPQGQGMTQTVRVFLLANLPLIGLGYLAGRYARSRTVLIAWLISVIIQYFLLKGFTSLPWLPDIPSGLWGGLIATMILAIGGIVLSFPIGVLLALGRRSNLPVVRIFSTLFIEVVRGVPLIGILILFSIVLPLFLPPDVRVDRLLRALVGMTLFSAAYMAENVRGGLAAVPSGQVEAAKALGLNGFQTTALIVLPQALRIVIPPMVGQFISLFKDTTLASGVAVVEFLQMGRSILQANPEYIRLQAEVYLFIAAVFWIFCYLMSYASLRLEEALGVGKR